MPLKFYFNYDQILSNGYNIFFKKNGYYCILMLLKVSKHARDFLTIISLVHTPLRSAT